MLSLSFTLINKVVLESNIMKNINNFKLLEYLKLSNFHLTQRLILELNNLKSLSLNNCKNIICSKEGCKSIKKLTLKGWEMDNNNQGQLLIFPNLETLKLEKSGFSFSFNTIDYIEIFDFKKSKNIKKYEGPVKYILFLDDNIPLEEVKLNLSPPNDYDKLRKALKKLLSFSTLKKFKMITQYLSSKDFINVPIENKSVTELLIIGEDLEGKFVLDSLLNKFPNVSKINLDISSYENNKKTILTIIENESNNIDQIKLNNFEYKNIIQFYCTKFENLIEIDIEFACYPSKLRHTLPLFADNCNVIFKSFIKFHFKVPNEYLFDDDKEDHIIKTYVIKNLYKNLDFMPNLKDFLLVCVNDDIDEKFYKQFVSKILSINLKSIFFSIKKSFDRRDAKVEMSYTENELKNLNHNIDYSKYDNIYIKNFNK